MPVGQAIVKYLYAWEHYAKGVFVPSQLKIIKRSKFNSRNLLLFIIFKEIYELQKNLIVIYRKIFIHFFRFGDASVKSVLQVGYFQFDNFVGCYAHFFIDLAL